MNTAKTVSNPVDTSALKSYEDVPYLSQISPILADVLAPLAGVALQPVGHKVTVESGGYVARRGSTFEFFSYAGIKLASYEATLTTREKPPASAFVFAINVASYRGHETVRVAMVFFLKKAQLAKLAERLAGDAPELAAAQAREQTRRVEALRREESRHATLVALADSGFERPESWGDLVRGVVTAKLDTSGSSNLTLVTEYHRVAVPAAGLTAERLRALADTLEAGVGRINQVLA